jgi:hypothetical protein
MSADQTTRQDIRAAKLTIESTSEGATLCIEAGELRLRLFIDGQWSDLLQQMHTSDEAGDMVPFRMRPIPASSVTESQETEEEAVISTASIGAHPIPGLSKKNPAHETPLWESTFPSLQAETDTERGDG